MRATFSFQLVLVEVFMSTSRKQLLFFMEFMKANARHLAGHREDSVCLSQAVI